MQPPNPPPPEGHTSRPAPWLNRTVVGAGLTSALGDMAYESTTAILPGFMVALGITAAPAALGMIEGLADATASFTKLGSGYLSDRLGHRKPATVLGYALSAFAQVLYFLAAGWPLILVARMTAWFGRGMRGPLRDAILAEAVPSHARGRAFGFHRAADTLGAIVGPLIGVALLGWFASWMPEADVTRPFRGVFLVSLVPGVLSVLSFAFLVREDRRAPGQRMGFWTTVQQLPRSFRSYLWAVGLFGVGDFAPTLLVLAATQLLTPEWGVARAAQFAASFYLWRNVVYAAASLPVGMIADRWGHQRVLLVGYAIGVGAAIGTAMAFTAQGELLLPLWIGIFTLAGLCIAIQDSLESTITADLVAEEIRGTGYGVLGTVNGVGDFLASAVVGAIWALGYPVAAFLLAAGVMSAGSLLLLRRAAVSA